MIALHGVLEKLLETREHSEFLCKPLELEDYVIQPVADVSPPKWHLGHTTWFFEAFILVPYCPDYKVFHADFSFVFNSYYETVGKRIPRANRGNLSRPTVGQVMQYRHYVTDHLQKFLASGRAEPFHGLFEIGIQHEQQHQELLLTDIKYILGTNPIYPVYSEHAPAESKSLPRGDSWISVKGGLYDIGYSGNEFCFDNELQRHQVMLGDFEIASELETNQSMLDFISDGGFSRFEFWHAEAWDWLKKEGIGAPLYWQNNNGLWYTYTLRGLQKLNPSAILSHISYYEAYALAQWKGCRLPTEFEWEAAHNQIDWGQRWEWTESAYLPYPGYRKADGALGEYNGKFMVNQKVLRGASIATPKGHCRPTYRNFFQPHQRWQYTGLRLAR